jgi:hypothetical protein
LEEAVALATARQLPALHAPHEEDAVYVVPPLLKVPTGQGLAVPALDAVGQK